eukprot:g4489.t1
MRNIPVVLCLAGGVALTIGIALQWRRYSRRLSSQSTSSPNPNWKLGDRQPCPFGETGMISLDPNDLTLRQCYPLMISGVVPRPVAFISSLSSDGIGNLAPFSYFAAVAHDPPCIAVSIARNPFRGGVEKDTGKNILDTKEFVVNIISEWFIESANYTCAPLNPEINEMELVNLTPVPSVKIKPPRVEESAFQMECRLKHYYDIHNKQGAIHATVFIGEVVMFHINKGIAGRTPSGSVKVDFENYKPISRLGGDTYGRVTSTFDLPRPDRTV